MSDELISCIVPVFNGERYLAEAIESILAQTYKNIEVIVADDGSTDDSCEVAKSFGNQVKLISQERAGPAATRNFGLSAAQGDLVSFLDADDLWHREKLTKQVQCFREHNDLDFCVTNVEMFWDENLATEAGRYRDHPRAGAIPGYATITLLARRKVFEQIGDFDQGLWFSDATDWFIRAKEAGLSSEVLPDVLVYHRMHPQNLTRLHEDESREEFLQIVKASLDRRRVKD